MDTSSWIALGLFILLNFAAASSGAKFKPGEWYQALRKPVWTPPNWAFPVVWAVLFCMNAASGWLVWETAGSRAAFPLAVYVASLAINAAWSWLFFGRRRMDLAMIDVGFLWLSIAVVIGLFQTVRPLAAQLMVPYLVWVTIAALLNLKMVQLNPKSVAQAS